MKLSANALKRKSIKRARIDERQNNLRSQWDVQSLLAVCKVFGIVPTATKDPLESNNVEEPAPEASFLAKSTASSTSFVDMFNSVKCCEKCLQLVHDIEFYRRKLVIFSQKMEKSKNMLKNRLYTGPEGSRLTAFDITDEIELAKKEFLEGKQN